MNFFVIFLFIANVTLANGNGTSELYDIKKGTLLEYFKDIEKETGYVLIYSKDIRPSLIQVVSVDLSRKKTITEKLSALFEKTNLVYEIFLHPLHSFGNDAQSTHLAPHGEG